jgi:hypothetical protein
MIERRDELQGRSGDIVLRWVVDDDLVILTRHLSRFRGNRAGHADGPALDCVTGTLSAFKEAALYKKLVQSE